jgi:hypothetical protein
MEDKRMKGGHEGRQGRGSLTFEKGCGGKVKIGEKMRKNRRRLGVGMEDDRQPKGSLIR